MPTLEELLKSKDKSVLDKIQEIVESSTAKRVSEGAPLSGQQIEAINQYPELVEKLDFSKSASAAPEALPEFPSAKQAIQSERGDQIIRNIMRSTETPDVSSKLASLDEAAKIASPLSSTVDDAANVLSKADEIVKPLSKYDEVLLKLQGMGQSALSNPTLSKLASKLSPVGKLAGVLGSGYEAISEANEAKKSFKEGHPLDAAVSGGSSAANAITAASMIPGLSSLGPITAAASIAAPVAIGRGLGKIANATYPEFKPSDAGGGDPVIGTHLIPPGQQPQVPVLASEEPKLDMPSGDQTFSEGEGIEIEAPAPVEMPSAAQQALLEQGFTNATVQNLMEAQKAANQNRLIANIMQGTGQIGAGIAGLGGKTQVKAADFKNLLESADVPLEQYKQQVEMEKKDPNSQYSVGFRNFAKPIIKQLGIDESLVEKMSGEQLGSLIPQLRSMYNEKVEGEYKKQALAESAKLREAERSDKKEEKEKQNKETFIEKARNQLKTRRDEFSKISRANSIVSSMDDKNAVAQVTALYSLISALDPGSVVREGEISLATSAGGLRGKMDNVIHELTLRPQLIDNKTIQSLKKEVARISKTQEDDYKTVRNSYLKQAKSVGVSEDRYSEIDPYYDQLKQKDQTSSSKQGKTVIKKGYNPKTNKTQLIYSDGTKEIVDGKQ